MSPAFLAQLIARFGTVSSRIGNSGVVALRNKTAFNDLTNLCRTYGATFKPKTGGFPMLIMVEEQENTNDRTDMEFTKYRLPDGQVVMLDSSATKNAKVTTFTLKGGIVVYAVRADVIAELSQFENVDVTRPCPHSHTEGCSGDRNFSRCFDCGALVEKRS